MRQNDDFLIKLQSCIAPRDYSTMYRREECGLCGGTYMMMHNTMSDYRKLNVIIGQIE